MRRKKEETRDQRREGREVKKAENKVINVRRRGKKEETKDQKSVRKEKE